MQILYLDHGAKLIGGGQFNTLSLIKSLDQARFTPRVLSSVENIFTEELTKYGVRVDYVNYPVLLTSTYRAQFKYNPLVLLRYFGAFLVLVLRLRRYLLANPADLLHPCDNVSRMACVFVSKLTGIPAVCQITDDYENTVANRILRKVLLLGMRKILPVSDKVGSFFRGSNPAAVQTIYTGIDMQYYQSSIAGSSLRVEYGISPKELIIGIVGLLHPIKGHKELFHALSKLKTISSVPFRCVIVGDGPEKEGLQRLSMELSIDKEVIFSGFRKDMPNVFGGLDILVAPSLSEASSRVVLEAGAFCVPSIGTRVGGIPEMIVENETGLLVNVGDIDALAEAIARLFAPGLRERMGRAAKRRVVAEFSNEIITRKIENVYCEVLGSKK